MYIQMQAYKLGTNMTGETNLAKLISTMRPVLLNERFVYVCIDYTNSDLIRSLQQDTPLPMASFTENEAYSFILTQAQAERWQIPYSGVYACITLSVHSSLEAVGLTAAVSNALSEQKISANVVAAFYHDHVFVASQDAERAVQTLSFLSACHSA